MPSEQRRRKNQAKHALWEAMSSEELKSMLGKRGRAKSIRAILRKRVQVEMLLNPVQLTKDQLLAQERAAARGQMNLYGT